MQLSKPGYYADFVVYPVLVPALMAVQIVKSTPAQIVGYACVWLVGIAAWTLLEYLLHRYVLHEVPGLEQMHLAHHADPTSLTGTPTWVSLAFILFGVFLPVWWAGGVKLACALTTGITIGYLWYISVHHMTHHTRVSPGSYLYRLKHRHNRHHYSPDEGNFGVTSGFWDVVFGTVLGARRPTAAVRQP